MAAPAALSLRAKVALLLGHSACWWSPAGSALPLAVPLPAGGADPALFLPGDCDDTGRCYPEIRIGALAGPSAAGHIFAFAEGRINAPSREVRVLLKRSSDGGGTWSRNATVAAYIANGTSGNPAPVVAADGRTLLLLFQHVDWAHHPAYSAFVTRSTDEGVSFSLPTNITAQVKGRYEGGRWVGLAATNWWDVGPPGGVVDARGRLVQCMNEEDPPVRDGGRPWVFSASSADGVRWTPSRVRQPLFGDGSGECQIARVGAGGRRLVMLARSQRPGTPPMGDDGNGTHEHAVSFSDDGGGHWSKPRQLTSALPGPNCEASIASAERNGSWQLFAAAPSNTVVHDDKGGLLRAGLALYTSAEGERWEKLRTVDANASAYSSLLVLPQSRSLLCLYEAGHGTAHQAPYGSIRLARWVLPVHGGA